MNSQLDRYHFKRTFLALVGCVTVAACTRANDRTAASDSQIYGTSPASDSASGTGSIGTASNTTVAVDDMSSASNDAQTASVDALAKPVASRHRSRTRTKSNHYKAAGALPAQPVVRDEDDSYFYDTELAQSDRGMMDPSMSTDAGDGYQDNGDIISGTTMPAFYRETGLSPFAQEPDSRIPLQIGSGQMTGEDRSTTFLDGAGSFQDPSALGRDLIR